MSGVYRVLFLLFALALSSCSLFSASHKIALNQGHIAPDSDSIKSIKLSQAKKYIGGLRWPVRNGYIISYFGKRWGNFHEGIDLSAPEGTPIVAAHDGEVVYSGDGLNGYGNLIVIKADGILTVYGHNRRNRADVGDKVKKGDHIGDVGQTGKATGPHVHFEIRIKNAKGLNVAVDPLVFYSPKK